MALVGGFWKKTEGHLSWTALKGGEGLVEAGHLFNVEEHEVSGQVSITAKWEMSVKKAPYGPDFPTPSLPEIPPLRPWPRLGAGSLLPLPSPLP